MVLKVKVHSSLLPLTPQNFSNFKKSTCSKDIYKEKYNKANMDFKLYNIINI